MGRLIAGSLYRWLATNALVAVPQAAAPIAFALILLPTTGDPNAGASLILAMTAAQVVGAGPVSRFGRRFDPTRYLRALIAVRVVAFAGIASLASVGAPTPWLVLVAAVGGFVNAAVFGYLRAALNALVSAQKLPRALGVAATLNELVFVSAPVLASFLGAVSPQAAAWVVAALSAVPMFLAPTVRISDESMVAAAAPSGRRVPMRMLVWLFCAAASGSTVAVIEIGAVSLAVRYGLDPTWAWVFVVALCVASVLGGVWVSARNRAPSAITVVVYLAVTASGIGLLVGDFSLPASLFGAVAVGALLAPLGTHYSLAVDALARPGARAEAFALLRTAGAVGVVVAAGAITFAGLQTALAVCCALTVVATVAAIILTSSSARDAREHRHPTESDPMHTPTLHRAPVRDIPAEILYKLLWLRVAVFVVEQRAAYPELDGRDLEPDTELLWIEENGQVLATARVLLDDAGEASERAARVGRVATAATARGRGLGADLMRAAVERAAERWPQIPIVLDAQAHLAGWYGQFGFVVSGPGFSEDDIPHVPMTRPAGQQRAEQSVWRLPGSSHALMGCSPSTTSSFMGIGPRMRG